MLMLGDCIDKLKTLPDCSVDAVVTDPPYGLAFMGKKWDYDVPAVEVWAECLRVLKPGGHLLAFAGTRTQHRMAVRIEDAGFEIRDMIAWVYGSGFPKSHDVSKAIDKAAGAERDAVPASGGLHKNANLNDDGWSKIGSDFATMWSNNPATDAARQWQGWGTALKPAMEMITVARKPLTGTVAENVQEWGTGAINVDACRVGDNAGWSYPNGRGGSGWHGRDSLANNLTEPMEATQGRWPANLIHDGSDEVVGCFPVTNGDSPNRGPRVDNGCDSRNAYMKGWNGSVNHTVRSDSGSAARFFYCAKASKADRDEGIDGFEERLPNHGKGHEKSVLQVSNSKKPIRNGHPTVKPCALMRYLCRLVTPPGGIVLDPFMGSGSTGKGAILEGFRFIGIERDPDYMQIAESRIKHAQEQAMEAEKMPHQLELEVASA